MGKRNKQKKHEHKHKKNKRGYDTEAQEKKREERMSRRQIRKERNKQMVSNSPVCCNPPFFRKINGEMI